MDERIYDDVKEIIGKVARIDPKTIKDDANLRDELCIDSLLAIQVVALLEEKFKIKIDEIEIFNVDNIKDVVELIKEYLNDEGKLIE
ncbi:MAG TPA: acyl carrier protein [Spirochaetota bacterium]|nr:acyl carrier protein [Spirochaetota bacterium]